MSQRWLWLPLFNRWGTGLRMASYYFDLSIDGGLARDDYGIDLASFDEAQDQAVAIVSDIARDQLPNGGTHDFVCEVRDDESRVLYRAKLMLRAERVDEPVKVRDGVGAA